MDTSEQLLDFLCRTCNHRLFETLPYSTANSKPRQGCHSIFDIIEKSASLFIAELITTIVPQIKVESSDELPKKICHKCYEQLQSIYRFQQMCIQTDQDMRQLIDNLSLEIKEEPRVEDSHSEEYKEHIIGATQTNEVDMIQNVEVKLESCEVPETDATVSVINEPMDDDAYVAHSDDGVALHSTITIKKEEQQEALPPGKIDLSFAKDEEEPSTGQRNVPRHFEVPQPFHESTATPQTLNSDSQAMSDMKLILAAVTRIEEGLKEIISRISAMEKVLTEKMPERAEVQAQGEILRECRVLNRRANRNIGRITGDMENEEQTLLLSLLPMSSEETVLKMEEHLTKEAYANAMSDIILQLKASKGSIPKVMQSLLSDKLAWHYNCNGGGGKKSLIALKVVDMVLAAFASLQKEKISALRHYVVLSHNRYKHVRRKFKKMNVKLV